MKYAYLVSDFSDFFVKSLFLMPPTTFLERLADDEPEFEAIDDFLYLKPLSMEP